MIQVLVKRPNDGTLVFQVDRLNRVSELKQMIEERSGVAPELQLLQFGEKPYEDEVTIEDIYNKSSCFQDNEVPVLMLARLRGGVNIVHHQRHYHEDLRKGVAQSWISSGDGAGGSSYLCQSDSGDGADGSSYLRQSDSGDGADGSSYLRQSDSDEEDCEDPFNIAHTKNAPADRLKRWRQAALVQNASRRFRYTLDLKKEEERETTRRKIEAHAQVIRAAVLFREDGKASMG